MVTWSPITTALEATLFAIARFDPVDFANQSIGACLAGLCVSDMQPTRLEVVKLCAIAFAALVGGFQLAFA